MKERHISFHWADKYSAQWNRNVSIFRCLVLWPQEFYWVQIHAVNCIAGLSYHFVALRFGADSDSFPKLAPPPFTTVSLPNFATWMVYERGHVAATVKKPHQPIGILVRVFSQGFASALRLAESLRAPHWQAPIQISWESLVRPLRWYVAPNEWNRNGHNWLRLEFHSEAFSFLDGIHLHCLF